MNWKSQMSSKIDYKMFLRKYICIGIFPSKEEHFISIELKYYYRLLEHNKFG